MQKLVKEYLEELNKRQKKNRRVGIAILLLAVLVIGGVARVLTQYGVAMTGKLNCGLEEHEHTDACYEKVLICGLEESEGHVHTEECQAQKELICGLEESEGHVHTEECQAPKELICELEEGEDHTHTDACYSIPEGYICGLEESEGHTHTDACYSIPEGYICGLEEGEGHTHTDACYEEVLICGKEEHKHTDLCYTDAAADMEDASVWNDLYADVGWKGIWSEDLITAAQMQIGYQESVKNYKIAKSGGHKGYTRYGHFAGDAYADWDAVFVNFCMFYAGMKSIDPAVFPDVIDSALWCEEFEKVREENAEYLTGPEGYVPAAGDIVFFQRENEETPCQMGVVSLVDEEKGEFTVIEGNSQNEVRENVYAIGDEYVVRYLKISELEAAYKDIEKTEEPEEEEAIIELTTEVDGITITLSGPESSFEAGKEYSIQAEKVESEEIEAAVEEAIANPDESVTAPEETAEETKTATEEEEQAKQIKSYQAFDIKLISDGQEVQPIGSVSVKFSGKKIVNSVEDDETEVKVIHVDETTGETTDMAAVATEESDVVIETDHFSVYVYVEVTADPLGGVAIDIQHWARNLDVVDGEYSSMNGAISEEGFEINTDAGNIVGRVKKKEDVSCKLYTTDEAFRLPNETYIDVAKLSKVYNVEEGDQPRYKIVEVWVSANSQDEDEPSWEEGTYTIYRSDELESSDIVGEILNLKDDSVIRFWYEPAEEKIKKEPVTFYDYDIYEKNSDGTLNGADVGINADGNYDSSERPKMGVGQASSGNTSSWVTDTYNGKLLNAGNNNLEFAGLVGDQLAADGSLIFNSEISVPNNLFTAESGKTGANGSTRYDDYQLGFSQHGDTYTLEEVYKGTEKTVENLTEFSSMAKWTPSTETPGSRGSVFSNDFWPLDTAEYKKDPLMGETQYKVGSITTPKNDFRSAAGHNWFFGMVYEIEFEVGEYTGPLQYYFRGDDDFWLFFDGELVVDLGGIHAALGKTFDIREDYLAKKNMSEEQEKAWLEATHTLKVYYMERGATGSCCYMQFTLPRAQVVSIDPPETTSYTVEKKWEDNENGFRPQDIQISLYKQKEGDERAKVRTITLPLRNDAGEYVDQNGNIVQNPVWTYTWTDLPKRDGRTGKLIVYDAEEEFIDDSNNSNPMLGYYYEKETDPASSTKITLTNYIVDKKIKVCKEWESDEKELANRPDTVTFVLYANGNEYKDHNGECRIIELSAANGWQGEFDHVPEYYYDQSTEEWKKAVYTVREYPVSDDNEFEGENGAIYGVKIRNVPIEEDEDIAESEKENYIASFIATNILLTKNICIEKISKSDNTKRLEGAEFTLYEWNEENVDENGKLKSGAKPIGVYETTADGTLDIQGLRFGEYYLTETKAPTDYILLATPIKIVVAETGVTADFQMEGWDSDTHVTLEENSKYVMQIPNELFYVLPSTGGFGIYWYIFSGLLLMAASLILYKKQNREVLMK